jgi:hypothetical protein
MNYEGKKKKRVSEKKKEGILRRDVPSQTEDELVPVTKQLYPIRLHTRAFLSY